MSEYGQWLSWTQLDHQCPWWLKLRRQGLPIRSRGIDLVYGSALHAGIEAHATGHPDPIGCATARLQEEVDASARGLAAPIVWHDGHNRGSLTDPETAKNLLASQITTWQWAFGSLRARAIEQKLSIQLTRPHGWTIVCYVDAITDQEALIDIKSTGRMWDDARARAHAGQLQLYAAAYYQSYHRPPSGAAFHVGDRNTLTWKVFEVPWDPAKINLMLEHRIRPTIRMIEADAYVPRVDGWWHSPKHCEYWHDCPFGAALEETTTS
jgi:hypothetical protein